MKLNKHKNKKVTASAPGKLMLFGEHAVLYGKPCIVTSVNQRMRVTVELLEGDVFKLNAPDVGIKNYQKLISTLGKGDIPKGAKFIEYAVLNFITKYKIRVGVKVTTKSEFSSKLGFGSSSASTVCTIKALSEITGKNMSDKNIFDMSYKTVLDIQGKASGFDVAAAVFGGTIYFLRGGKVIKPLDIKSLPLIIGYSGIKADTVTVINEVSKKSKKFPEIIDNIYSSIGKLVDTASNFILEQDFANLGELMNFNQSYLSALGVSIKKLDRMISGAIDAGSYGAKLSGAGMGDCMIALSPPNKVRTVKTAIKKAGGKVINIKTNVQGVRIEK